MSEIKKAVLAYSGGLDTSVILKWLQDTYQCEIVTFTADLGQGEELEPARTKALQFGIKPENIFIDDLREEFVRAWSCPALSMQCFHRQIGEGKVDCPETPSRCRAYGLEGA